MGLRHTERIQRRDLREVQIQMHVRADVKCYFCGHTAGEVEGEYATISKTHTFKPLTERDQRTVRGHGALRCPRCDGPVYLEGIEPLRVRRSRVPVTAADFADLTYGKAKAS